MDKFVICALPLLLTACGGYYHYGLKVNTSENVLPQKDSFYITDGYEFKSVLFASGDGNLTILLQHPLHPLPEPNKVVSQVEFHLNDNAKGGLTIHSLSFSHQSVDSTVIEPVERRTIGDDFYVLQYQGSLLPEQIYETVFVNFSYDGSEYQISFREIVKKVKRWNKLHVLLNS
ncbi:hypothetical protein [Photobacterium kasasachensis]|uniref:hypothetical protein n=1 Tax=Photobacterium kasasachensis TaxID=2910240 RepID=UPI003D099D76